RARESWCDSTDARRARKAPSPQLGAPVPSKGSGLSVFSQPLPLHKPLDRLVLRQAELVVLLGGVAVAVLGALPEFPRVAGAGQQGLVLLALVLEDGHALAEQLVGAERHGHLDLVDSPLLPGAAVEPD